MADRTIGNYVLGPLLGRGGMSEVHAGEHRFLGDRVAIKLLRSHLAGDAAATEAFVAEATRTRAIDHPGVVRVLDFGSDGDAFYLVMERLDGESLAARLARCGRLDEAEVRRLGAAIADGLAAAHDRGIVHRDLKPGNVMLVGDQPKIIDFGIAREVARSVVTGSRVGTIAYMAPEQLTGGLIAPCIDIWALGVVLYEALAGRLPFDGFDDGRSPQLFETAPRLAAFAAVSPALEALIASCLEREPGKRPASMHALAGALRGSSSERLTEDVAPPRLIASGAQPATDAHRAPARRRTRSIAVLGALTVLVAGSLWLIFSPASHRPSVVGAAAATADRAPAAEDRSPSAERREPAAASREPAADGRKPAADGREPIADGRAPAAVSRKPIAASREPAAGADATAGAGAATGAAGAAARKPASFTVEVRSAPSGAHVVVAGKRVGVTPATIALDAPASITVSRAGYRSQRVRAERPGPIDVRLVPARPAPSRPRPAPAGETLD